jgi:hypothetical protein
LRLYHKSRPDSTGKYAFILPQYSAPAKPLLFKGVGQGAEFMIFARRNPGAASPYIKRCSLRGIVDFAENDPDTLV